MDLDQALFRLSGQVFFLTDINKVHNSLKVLDCLDESSYLSIYLGKTIEDLKKIAIPQDIEGFGTFSKGNLAPYIDLEKLKLSSLGRGKDELQKQELQGLGKECAKILWNKLEISEKALLLTEVYLRDRFKRNEQLNSSLSDLKKGLSVKEKHELLSFKMSPGLSEKLETFIKVEEGSTHSREEVPNDENP